MAQASSTAEASGRTARRRSSRCLTAAARVGLLTDDEQALAYAYASKAAQRYVDFWISKATGSVNLWDEGRRTDDYRGKFRILGENYRCRTSSPTRTNRGTRWASRTSPRWPTSRRRWTDCLFKPSPGSRRAPPIGCSSHAATLVISIALPLINGGASQHMHHPYFPIPFLAACWKASRTARSPCWCRSSR